MSNLTKIEFDPNKLRLVRERAGLSQSQAAEKVGISRQRLNNYEQQKTQPDPTTLLRLIVLYNLDLRALANRRIAA